MLSSIARRRSVGGGRIEHVDRSRSEQRMIGLKDDREEHHEVRVLGVPGRTVAEPWR